MCVCVFVCVVCRQGYISAGKPGFHRCTKLQLQPQRAAGQTFKAGLRPSVALSIAAAAKASILKNKNGDVVGVVSHDDKYIGVLFQVEGATARCVGSLKDRRVCAWVGSGCLSWKVVGWRSMSFVGSLTSASLRDFRSPW